MIVLHRPGRKPAEVAQDTLKLGFHCVVLGFDLLTLRGIYYLPAPKESPFGSRMVYLTILGVYCHTLYFTLALVNDLCGYFKVTRSAPVAKAANRFFTTVVFPFLLFICLFYYTLVHNDKLVIAKRQSIPFFEEIMHLEHGLTFIFCIIELLCVDHHFGDAVKDARMVTVLTTAYGAWIFLARIMNGIWPYPFMNDIEKNFGGPTLMGLMAGFLPCAVMFYFFGRGLHGFFHGTPSHHHIQHTPMYHTLHHHAKMQ